MKTVTFRKVRLFPLLGEPKEGDDRGHAVVAFRFLLWRKLVCWQLAYRLSSIRSDCAKPRSPEPHRNQDRSSIQADSREIVTEDAPETVHFMKKEGVQSGPTLGWGGPSDDQSHLAWLDHSRERRRL
jgi:hypothetical protein